jgi:hypothetical protein
VGKMKEFTISRNSFETGLEVEISVKTKENVSDLESYLKGVELLIDSIDLKSACSGDIDQHQESLKRILFMIADNIGIEGGYDHLELDYDEETDQPIIKDNHRIELLKSIINNLS